MSGCTTESHPHSTGVWPQPLEFLSTHSGSWEPRVLKQVFLLQKIHVRPDFE